MDDLFSASTRERSFQNAPLAVRMRPNSLDEYVGQQKAVGKGSWLRAAIEHDVLSSVILYGPAGTGKTTLAHIIANHTKSEFVEVSAVTGTVKDLRRVIDEAKTRLNTYDRRTILFIDEIHRFSRSQQDALLHAVDIRRDQYVLRKVRLEFDLIDIRSLLHSALSFRASHIIFFGVSAFSARCIRTFRAFGRGRNIRRAST